jgi:hypothetical protein
MQEMSFVYNIELFLINFYFEVFIFCSFQNLL